MLVTQPASSSHKPTEDKIPRVSKSEMAKDVGYNIKIARYMGPKKPDMPHSAAKKCVPSLAFLAGKTVTLNRAREIDFAFFQDVINNTECPEYHGYYTRLCLHSCHQCLYLYFRHWSSSPDQLILTTRGQRFHSHSLYCRI